MILDEKKVSVAYRCPACGKGVISVIGVFSLSGDVLKLKCECGRSELVIQRSSDGGFRFTVPCFICPRPHFYKVSREAIFSKELFCLGCTYTGFDTCFIGEHEKVLQALDESANTLEGLAADAGVDDLDMLHGGDADLSADDPMIDEVIRFTIADLREAGELYCGCKDKEKSAYFYEFTPPDYTDLRIYCAGCGFEKLIPMTSITNAHAFLDIDELRLEPPAKEGEKHE